MWSPPRVGPEGWEDGRMWEFRRCVTPPSPPFHLPLLTKRDLFLLEISKATLREGCSSSRPEAEQIKEFVDELLRGDTDPLGRVSPGDPPQYWIGSPRSLGGRMGSGFAVW